jgi:hypothetical protein
VQRCKTDQVSERINGKYKVKISLRSSGSDTDVAKIARTIDKGGNGHPIGAGCLLCDVF